MTDYIPMVYASHAAAGKAAVTIALAWQQDELSDEDYYKHMGEIVKHHPLALIYTARYAALGLMTAATKGPETATEMWQKIGSQIDMDDDEEF